MKKLLLILLCLPMIGFGQGWIKGYADVVAYSVDQTNDGGYIISGGTGYENVSDIFVAKMNANGDKQWSKIFGE